MEPPSGTPSHPPPPKGFREVNGILRDLLTLISFNRSLAGGWGGGVGHPGRTHTAGFLQLNPGAACKGTWGARCLGRASMVASIFPLARVSMVISVPWLALKSH